MSSAGEQLGLAFTCAVESELWKAAEDFRYRDMGQRALIELQSHFIIGTGHGLINVALRALALHLDTRNRLEAIFKTSFPPYSENQRDWKSLNANEADKLKRAVAESEAVLRSLVRPVISIAQSQEWSSLLDRRGRIFTAGGRRVRRSLVFHRSHLTHFRMTHSRFRLEIYRNPRPDSATKVRTLREPRCEH
jgi:hypothetical protein